MSGPVGGSRRLVLLGIVQAELIWNYSATELGRLFVPPGATLRLGFLLLALFGADRLLSGRRGGDYPLRTSPDSSAG